MQDKIKCVFCDKEMRLDDVDFRFKGCQDNYYVCDFCKSSAYEKIRYNKSIGITWHFDD